MHAIHSTFKEHNVTFEASATIWEIQKHTTKIELAIYAHNMHGLYVCFTKKDKKNGFSAIHKKKQGNIKLKITNVL